MGITMEHNSVVMLMMEACKPGPRSRRKRKAMSKLDLAARKLNEREES